MLNNSNSDAESQRYGPLLYLAEFTVLTVQHHTVNISDTQHRISLAQLENKVLAQLTHHPTSHGFLLGTDSPKLYVFPSLSHVIAADGVGAGPSGPNKDTKVGV